jgi:hypothetical protein
MRRIKQVTYSTQITLSVASASYLSERRPFSHCGGLLRPWLCSFGSRGTTLLCESLPWSYSHGRRFNPAQLFSRPVIAIECGIRPIVKSLQNVIELTDRLDRFKFVRYVERLLCQIFIFHHVSDKLRLGPDLNRKSVREFFNGDLRVLEGRSVVSDSQFEFPVSHKLLRPPFCQRWDATRMEYAFGFVQLVCGAHYYHRFDSYRLIARKAGLPTASFILASFNCFCVRHKLPGAFFVGCLRYLRDYGARVFRIKNVFGGSRPTKCRDECEPFDSSAGYVSHLPKLLRPRARWDFCTILRHARIINRTDGSCQAGKSRLVENKLSAFCWTWMDEHLAPLLIPNPR